MDDTIYRQAAIDAIRAFYDEFIVYDNGKSIEDLISELPSAQSGITLESAIDYLHSIGWMQEHDRTLTESARKKGKWNERSVFDAKDMGMEEMQSAKCSVCGRYHTTPYLYFFDNFNFCPNCGADMRGEQDE